MPGFGNSSKIKLNNVSSIMTKRAAIYDPYLDTLGGGERYCLTVAEILLQNGYSVDIFWSGDPNLIKKATDRFNLDLSKLNIVDDIFNVLPQKIDAVEDTESLVRISSHHPTKPNFIQKISSIINKYKITRQYNLFFYISDWSVPFLFSQNNLLHVQVPFVLKNNLKEKILNKIKLIFFHNIICNSQFTQKFAANYFGNKCRVIYPPVDVAKFSVSSQKDNIILSVGRFDNLLNSKKQDIMIEAFKQVITSHPKTDWKLVLVGGSLESPEKNSYLHHLQRLSSGFPVEFFINPDFKTLSDTYSRSKIYWHAAGYEVDETLHPESTEHFGIAPVEAMASGLVPLVIAKGGLPEIVDDGKNGYLWKNMEDLIAKTNLLIDSDQLLKENSQAAIIKSQDFSKEKFAKNLLTFINK
jgi:glycosyltransferase involved in cell wall biosynthesis